jgi:CUB domain.
VEYSSRCYYDFVRVFDADSMNSTRLLAKLCGDHSKSPPILHSTGNKMLVQFVSDHYDNYPGFAAAVIFQTGALLEYSQHCSKTT